MSPVHDVLYPHTPLGNKYNPNTKIDRDNDVKGQSQSFKVQSLISAKSIED
jgi:hypothetical protein